MCDPELESNQLCISTQCRTIEEFISTFDRYVTEDSIFMSTPATRPVGLETAFVILLADGAPVLRGTCIVRDVRTTPDGPFGAPGICLGITRLSPRSLPVFQQMQIESKTLPSLSPPPPPPPPPTTDEGPPVEPPSPAPELGMRRRPVTRMMTTRQYFSPVPRASSAPLMFTPDSLGPAHAPTADDAGESFSAPTRVVPAMTFEPSTPGRPAPTSSRWMKAAWLLAGIAIAGLSSTGAPSSPTRPSPVSAPVAGHDTTETVESPAAAGAPCRVHVASTPTGASVAFDGTLQGSAPLAIDASCGQHRIEISHPGYDTMTTWATLAAGHPERIDVPLARPIHSVLVSTWPSGATIYIDGSPAGITPRRLNVLGHVPVTLEIKKPGYRPVTEHLFSTTPRDWLGIRLTREPPKARRVAKR